METKVQKLASIAGKIIFMCMDIGEIARSMTLCILVLIPEKFGILCILDSDTINKLNFWFSRKKKRISTDDRHEKAVGSCFFWRQRFSFQGVSSCVNMETLKYPVIGLKSSKSLYVYRKRTSSSKMCQYFLGRQVNWIFQ